MENNIENSVWCNPDSFLFLYHKILIIHYKLVAVGYNLKVIPTIYE